MSSLQKRLASQILKVGQSKIWLDPENKKDMAAAITKADVRKLIMKGMIKVRADTPSIKQKRKKGKRKKGSRRGSKHAIVTAKTKWITTVRALRGMLKDLKIKGQLDNQTYRKLYMLVKGGMFRSRSHLRIYIEQHHLLKKSGEKIE